MTVSDLSTINPDTPLTSCDGQGLRRLLQAGLQWLEVNYETVNSLNVFPVPDGDTGTNMLLTMQSAYREIEGTTDTHAGTVSSLIYNGALMGARGNSGVILSQLLRGFARGIEDNENLTSEGFVSGLYEASKMAYKAVQSPVEGTILTVSKDIAEVAKEVATDSDDIRFILEKVVEESHESVKRTPDLLPVLKDAGVVDSGGVGLTYILEGMLRYLNNQSVGEGVAGGNQGTDATAGPPEYDPDYPYDVQFLIKGDMLDVDKIRADIEAMGDSGVIVGDANLVKVHIHVKNPGVPVGYGADLGSIDDVVVENMYEQYLEFTKKQGTDTHSLELEDIAPPEVEPGNIASVVVAPGRGFRNIFHSIGAGAVISGGQTMNPSTQEILEAIESLPTDFVVILPNNKNILMAAEQAAQKANGKQVHVTPTRTVPQGISAQLMMIPDGDFDDVVAEMDDACTMVETGEITRSVRDVTLDGLEVKKDQLIGLHNDVMCVAGDNLDTVMLALLEKIETEDFELITLYYGEDVAQEHASQMKETIQSTYPEHEIELRAGGQAHYYYIIGVE